MTRSAKRFNETHAKGINNSSMQIRKTTPAESSVSDESDQEQQGCSSASNSQSSDEEDDFDTKSTLRNRKPSVVQSKLLASVPTTSAVTLYNATPPPIKRRKARQTCDIVVGVTVGLSKLEVQSTVNDEMDPSDSSESDDNVEKEVDKYDVSAEELPKTKFFDPSFQAALGQARNFMSNLSQSIEISPLLKRPSADLSRLHKEMRRLSVWESPATRKIAFVGDTGVGKSSLISALLDVKGLALSGCDGTACTSVVTEYHYDGKRSTSSFGIEIDFMDDDEIDELLVELLSSFRKHNDKLPQEFGSTEQENQIKDEQKRASDTLQALFPSQFQAEKFHSTSPGAEKRLLETLQAWAVPVRKLLPQTTSGMWTTEVHSVAECHDVLRRYTQSQENLDCELWPFVSIVRVFVRATVLRSGVILADLPGLRDLNRARLDITEQYLLKDCDEILAVADISRAASNEGIHDIIARCGRMKPIRVICTKAEIVDIDEFLESKLMSKKTAAALAASNTSLKKLQIARQRVEEKLKFGTATTAKFRKWQDLKEQCCSLEFMQQNDLMKIRNAKIVSELNAKYRELVSDDQLKIFCVSSNYYASHRADLKSEAGKHLELSGIVDLRAWCRERAAEAQFASACSYLEHDVVACLKSCKIWLAAGNGRHEAEALKSLKSDLDVFERNMRNHILSLSSADSELEQSILKSFRMKIGKCMRLKQDMWAQTSVKVARDWASWHHASYAAYCRGYGECPGSKAQPGRNWNKELIENMEHDLKPEWAKLNRSISNSILEQEHAFDQIVAYGVRELNGASKDLLQVQQLVEEVVSSMRPRRGQFQDIIEEAFAKFEGSIKIIKLNSLGYHGSSYISKAMKPVYDNAKQEHGTGMSARQKAIVGGSVANDDHFLNIGHLTTQKYKNALRTLTESLTREMLALLDDVRCDFNVVRHVKISESDEDRDFAKTFSKTVASAEKGMDMCWKTVQAIKEA